MKRPAVAMLALLTLTLVGACSDDGGGERPSEGEAARVATAVESYIEAFRTGDVAAARALLSARCTAALPEDQFATVVAAGAEAYPELAVESWGDVEVDGETATVDYETGVEDLDNRGEQTWVSEGGEWKYDSC